MEDRPLMEPEHSITLTFHLHTRTDPDLFAKHILEAAVAYERMFAGERVLCPTIRGYGYRAFWKEPPPSVWTRLRTWVRSL